MQSINEISIKGEEYFKQGYNCAQAVVLSFKDIIGENEQTLLKMSSSFGGGMGRLREVCGAVSGMFMVLGLVNGYTDPNDNLAKTNQYKTIQELAKKFSDQTGSIVCRELLGLNVKVDAPIPEKRTESYYKKRPCKDLVRLACEIIYPYVVKQN